MESQKEKKKKNVEPRNRKQSTAYSELPFFEIQSSATPTSSRGESEKKKTVEPCNREQSTAYPDWISKMEICCLEFFLKDFWTV